MRIALDAMGGDFAPIPNVQGAMQAIGQNKDLTVILVGDQSTLESYLDSQGLTSDRIFIVGSDGVVGMDEKPTVALREKPNCSIARCWKLMAGGEADAVVSAGNTGAVVAAGLRTRLFLKGVKRPGIAVTLPTRRGASVLLDVGANPDARPEHLLQYGVMGSIYAREFLGAGEPLVGLMNIGSEDGKGNDLYRETHQRLSVSRLSDRYVGNVEGRGLYQGEADVLLCEGFVGNIILKVSEGIASFMMQSLAESLLAELKDERERAGAVLSELGRRYRYQEAGGAPLLGIDGTCIICHGSSDADSVANALLMAVDMDAHNINSQIVEQLAMHTANV
ncbi:MAG: phosphate acyltransferase PlsX [Fuerstiella sp.]|nr:phosphate acyltransferase PlsX [Fuerstiella sp.]